MYPSDLSDAQWQLLAQLIGKYGPQPSKGGRPRIYDLRDVLDGIFYVAKTGCQWRQLPTDFPPWETVYGYFRRWRRSGLWQRLWWALHRQVREHTGRSASPSIAIIDSQSAKTSLKGGSAVLTRARKPRGASATSRWTAKAG